ncbi:Retrovirus-related Pol polyprotein from transposon TNT 1-94 [Senna tora]|uniref:Retrovirus-related Pol polyprotein from transposon TNT 1-94 n=1 Tax=Senna tora TaxID=362788 RepID=A0A834WN13_9FABA|nr:Retrovirus-related Pol polyprotein from transposon TNT 1-94 [Senna tora]
MGRDKGLSMLALGSLVEWQMVTPRVRHKHHVTVDSVYALTETEPTADATQAMKDLWLQANKRLLEELKVEKINLPDEFVAGIQIEKLPESRSDYKQQLKHKQKQLSLTDLITHIIIDDTNQKMIRIAKGKELATKENLVESDNKRCNSSNKNSKKTDYKPSGSNPKFNKQGNCFVCVGKTSANLRETVDPFNVAKDAIQFFPYYIIGLPIVFPGKEGDVLVLLLGFRASIVYVVVHLEIDPRLMTPHLLGRLEVVFMVLNLQEEFLSVVDVRLRNDEWKSDQLSFDFPWHISNEGVECLVLKGSFPFCQMFFGVTTRDSPLNVVLHPDEDA